MIKTRQIRLWFILFLLSLLGFSSVSLAQKNEKRKGKPNPKDKYEVVMTPPEAEILVGEECQFSAQVVDSVGNPVQFEGSFVWSLTGKNIGTIDTTGLFVGSEKGSARVVATIGRLSGKAKITVVEDRSNRRNKLRIFVIPRDTVVAAGDSVAFSAVLVDTSNIPIDTTFTWRVQNETVASIDTNGLFVAIAKGHTFVYASVGSLEGKAHVTILRDSTDWWYRYRGFKVRVEPRDTTVQIGETVQFSASLADSAGNVIDTVFTWSIDGGGFGTIDSTTGLFTALAKGQGFVWAHVGNLSGKGHITVLRDTSEHWSNRKDYRLVIQPENELVFIGDMIEYSAFLVDSLGDSLEVLPRWEVLGQRVGTIDEDGLFLATRRGTGVIKAKLPRRYTRTTRVRVISELDISERDTANIRFRDRNGQPVGNIHQIGESDILKITGLDFPLNILNGGEIYLPPGSIDEGIWIDITLPESALIGDSTVTFMDEIVMGIAFHVTVNDTLVSPYYFKEPVHIVLPYKPDLMTTLGLEPEDLWVFFYTNETFDSTDVFNVVLDTTEHKIYVNVNHFSELVLANKTKATTTKVEDIPLPIHSTLYDNYPNPFNPETEIRFDLGGGGGLQRVQLEVFNLLGQKVCTLVDKDLTPGHYSVSWNGFDERGEILSSGVYIYRLQGEGFKFCKRMVLIR